MTDKLSHGDLVAKIAMNSRLTALEVEEALEVMSTVVQQVLRDGGSIDFRGVGALSLSSDKQVVFEPGKSLMDAIQDPEFVVRIERRPDFPRGPIMDVENAAEYVHKVNVC